MGDRTSMEEERLGERATERAPRRPSNAGPRNSQIPVSGAYSVKAPGEVTTLSPDRPSASGSTPPGASAPSAPAGLAGAIAELRQRPLAALTLAADRRVLDTNESARRLLALDVGLDLDDGRVRCTDSRQAARFARAVHDAARAQPRGRVVTDVIELGTPGTAGWLDVVVASPRNPQQGAVALVVVRCRA